MLENCQSGDQSKPEDLLDVTKSSETLYAKYVLQHRTGEKIKTKIESKINPRSFN